MVTVVLHPEVAAAGFGWLALGVLLYLAYRRRQGLDLSSTHKVAIPQPVVDHEAEYDSVLVPLIDGALGWLECRIAAEHATGDHTLFVGDVVAVEPGASGAPLVRHEGGYGAS